MNNAGVQCDGTWLRIGVRAAALLLSITLWTAIAEGQSMASPAPRTTASDLGLKPFPSPLRPDTILHALGGAMSGFLAASIAAEASSGSLLHAYPLFLPAVGLSAAVAAGIGKETLDSTGFGDPQWSDIVHTIYGGILAAGFIAAVESSGRDPNILAAAGLSFALPVSAAFVKEIVHYLRKRGHHR